MRAWSGTHCPLGVVTRLSGKLPHSVTLAHSQHVPPPLNAAHLTPLPAEANRYMGITDPSTQLHGMHMARARAQDEEA